MDEPIEEVYFKWLYSKVASEDNSSPSNTFWELLSEMHSIEFVWIIPGDDNRAQDGLDLRIEFLHMANLSVEEHSEWVTVGCSVFEMMVGMSRRAEFATEITAREWFWRFLQNIRLDEFNDAYISSHAGSKKKIQYVIDRLVWRTYSRRGTGGLFPIEKTSNDQRKVELWYQFCEYLVEQKV